MPSAVSSLYIYSLDSVVVSVSYVVAAMDKGKGIDPANFGGIDLFEDDLDPRRQREALRN
jgi:hypothetical protein